MLANFENSIYWSDPHSGSIWKAHKRTGANLTMVTKAHSVTSLKVKHDVIQPAGR